MGVHAGECRLEADDGEADGGLVFLEPRVEFSCRLERGSKHRLNGTRPLGVRRSLGEGLRLLRLGCCDIQLQPLDAGDARVGFEVLPEPPHVSLHAFSEVVDVDFHVLDDAADCSVGAAVAVAEGKGAAVDPLLLGRVEAGLQLGATNRLSIERVQLRRVGGASDVADGHLAVSAYCVHCDDLALRYAELRSVLQYRSDACLNAQKVRGLPCLELREPGGKPGAERGHEPPLIGFGHSV